MLQSGIGAGVSATESEFSPTSVLSSQLFLPGDTAKKIVIQVYLVEPNRMYLFVHVRIDFIELTLFTIHLKSFTNIDWKNNYLNNYEQNCL